MVAFFTLLVLAGTSIIAMTFHEAERLEGRTALLASNPSPTDLNVKSIDDVWRGDQFPVVWIEPGGDAESALPPGMGRMPEPGQSVVSPELDRLASLHPELASRYPSRLVLDNMGVTNGDELLAYVRMPEGRTLRGALAGDISEDTRAVRVSGFGAPSPADVSLPIVEPFSEPLSVGAAVKGTLIFLIVPGFIVLAVFLLSTKRVHYGRFEHAGRRAAEADLAPRGRSVLETLNAAVPACIGVTALWAFVSPRLTFIPLVGHDVLRGDLSLPWWILLTVPVGCLAAICIVEATVHSIARAFYPRTRQRTSSERVSLSPLRVVPLGAALASFVAAGVVGGYAGVTVSYFGAILAVIGVTLAFPYCLRAIGSDLEGSKSAAVAAVGTELERDPVGAARPFLGVAALVALALIGSGIIDSPPYVEASPPSGNTQAVLVEWMDARSGDLGRLADALGAGQVIPFEEGGHGHDHEHGHPDEQEDALIVGAACRQLAPHFPGTECDPRAPHELPDETERSLAEIMAPVAYDPAGTSVRLAPAADVVDDGHAVVFGEAPLDALEQRVRVAAMEVLPAPYVTSALSGTARTSPQTIGWFTGGVLAALSVLTVGCSTALVCRSPFAHERRRHSSDPGVSDRRMVPIEALYFGVPYGVAVAIGSVAGLAICKLLMDPGFVMPLPGLVVTLAVAAAVGLAGVTRAALFGTRGAGESHAQEGGASPGQSGSSTSARPR